MNIFYEIPVLPSVNRDDNKMCYETVAPKNNLLPTIKQEIKPGDASSRDSMCLCEDQALTPP